ncbi:UDP-N-acetylmuramoylalanine--D-glutamate ligase [Spirochaetia bacterium]|nr:UDP-N-acetylmuramoylalanine--D-glutamate ligase [Spirochaetia bacterium]
MNYAGMKVTIMGLGLNGGGLESARYLALHGAECTVTDMKDEAALGVSIEKLESIAEAHTPFRYVLGRHEMEDFSRADMVIKNPGVRPDSPYLAAARSIETDISLFLAANPARLTAVTGSKGKSSTASALHWVLAKARETASSYGGISNSALLPGKARLGGNITVSPLSFLDELSAGDDVVLELSSWQLGDLKGRSGEILLKPRAAVLTAIMADHQDRYGSMEAYVNDKRIIYQGQDKSCVTVASADDDWGRSFLTESPGRPLPYSGHASLGGKIAGGDLADGDLADGGWIDAAANTGMIRLAASGAQEAVPAGLLVPGRHQKKNLLAAALALADLGLPVPFIREHLGTFPGIEHRLEFFHEKNGIRFYNDTAATIPEAAAAAVEALTENKSPLVLVTGGTDKNLDFSPLVQAAAKAAAIILLAGTGSDKLASLFTAAGISFQGPFDNLDTAVETALEEAKRLKGGAPEGRLTAALSPGCASFGMFKNEFDRGRRWKDTVLRTAL